MDNDAKSCYDRIIKTLALIACIGVGLPMMAAAMHNRTHHGMVHQIKSRHGLFRSYSGSDHDELEGTGQGSGASPAIWLIYSVSLLAAYAKFSEGMTVLSPYDDISVLIRAIFYVDDGMPGVSDSTKQHALPLPTLLKQAGEAAQSWERLLFASGGALELSKCFTYIIYWDLSEGKHRLLLPQEIPECQETNGQYFGPIKLSYGDISQVRHTIATESPWVGRRTLGVRIAPAGNWTDEFTYRRLQSRELALQISGSSINRETARVGYFSMVCPKLEFPLGATQFTQKECDAISSPVLRACLSKMSYNCNMPREVVYGPSCLFGLGMHDYYIEQGIQQISTLVGHLREDSETGRMMRIELQWCQVQAGTATHLLADPTDPIDYIETCWIMSIRDFLRTYGFRIDFTSSVIPTLQCDGDEFIMDALRLRGGCTSTDLIRLNACRMYLQVARLSEIVSAEGRAIRDEILRGKESDFFSSQTIWPRQGRPPKSWWNLWKKKIKLAFSADGDVPTLRKQLGKWNSHMRLTEWSTLASTGLRSTEVYIRDGDGNYRVSRGSSSHSCKPSVRISDFEVIDRIPAGAVPATLGPQRKDGSCRVYLRGLSNSECIRKDAIATFAEYVAMQPSHIAKLLEKSDLTDDTASAVSDKIRENRHLYCGTDGGLLDGKGSFGFIWGSSETGNISGAGNGLVPGPEIGMSSTRTELCGIFAALSYLKLVKNYFAINDSQQTLQCTLVCDSKAALQRVAQLDYSGFGTTWRCRANYDFEAAIRDCLEQKFVSVKWQWVRGHASRRKQSHNFTWEETLNEKADELATAARAYVSASKMEHWPEQMISVEGPRGRVTGRLAHEIRYCCTAPDLESYWQTRFNWAPNLAKLIDITGTKAVESKLRPASRCRIQKLRCGWLPVNSRESRSDPDRPAGCSACSAADLVPETVDHVFQCTHTARRHAILERFSSFHSHFRAMKTPTILLTAIKSGAMAWLEGKEIPSVESMALPDSELGRLVAQAYKEQTSLGWNVLFRGFWTTTWRRAQELEYQRMTCRDRQDNGESWAGRAQLWFFDLFEYVWGLRNADEHGSDVETQRLVRRTKCERAIRRLYASGEKLPIEERHPFRDSIEDLLLKSTTDQEMWITKTEAYLQKAHKRVRERLHLRGQPAITKFFARLPT